MKNLYKYVFMGILALGLGSCDDDEENVTVVVQDTVETGAVLRTIQIISNELPIGLDAGFAVELEEQDEFGGDLLQSVDVFATFADNSENDGDTAGANFNEFAITTITAEQFEDGPFGLPRYTLEVPADVLNAGAGVTGDQLFGGDTFTIRLALTLTDGRVFSSNNAGGIITGGFFNSPFQYTATVTCPVDSAFAIGDYNLVVTSGVFPDFGATQDFSEGVYSVVSGGGDTARTILAVPFLPEFGTFVGPINFNLVCGQTLLPNQALGGGVGCGGAVQGDSMGTTFGAYDPADDSEFTLGFIITAGDSGSTCPSAPYTSVLTLTRQ
ncbi:hypothetical protein [uncultured Dokdonia sp.]|uniref:hypothetical protein n=1 Tax=uncultured Dokdonia sp. TaxID=575653 RepID=UPI00261028C8|nr:hypothetical protein [uncultured Dokdonia sp.]